MAFHSIHNSTIHVAYIHASEIPVMGWIILIINNLIILSELSLFNSHMSVLVVCKGPLPDPLGDILVKSPLCPREPCVPARSNITALVPGCVKSVQQCYSQSVVTGIDSASIEKESAVDCTNSEDFLNQKSFNDCAVVL